MEPLLDTLNALNDVIWHEYVLFFLLAVGVLFTIWSGVSQVRALTHGTPVILGKYDDKGDPGAINHFQALSAALSATVGLGNIAGVALAIALGGPGAVFWMWMVGLVGMALKTTEVTLSMLYRNTDDPENPHGGPMWVVKQGFSAMGPKLAPVGSVIGGIFCITLLISTITGGNMFQAWNVGIVTEKDFGVPQILSGIVMALIVGVVIIGGIKRIGAVAGRLVPFMCGIYLLAAFYVIAVNITEVPAMLALIVRTAFNPLEAQGAFVGGTFGYALVWGMKRALFSSEAGQGSSPIAHSAAKTDEPVREGVVAGLEPFIDTIVVCTLTALVLLLTGAWNREPNATFDEAPRIVQGEQLDQWRVETGPLPESSRDGWQTGTDMVFLVVQADENRLTGGTSRRVMGNVTFDAEQNRHVVSWSDIVSLVEPRIEPLSEGGFGVYRDYPGAALTSHAFNRVQPGLGKWLVTIASWLFAISTMISWSYYGEQGMIYLLGSRSVLPYKFVYCLLIVAACVPGFITTDVALDTISSFGTGVMLWANIPIMLIFGRQAMNAYHDYFRRFKAGEMDPPHAAPSITDVVEGRDVQ
ncbi:alanine/glycine:cation symporter family protein [Tautonia marina]|uniref:alanine/glycine:cation symporter family protein n=1 Tax=Tautonia marina TaxID=2653855 RepID=UPI001260946B|nr:amino acid carrier protein [Tautonia marina]